MLLGLEERLRVNLKIASDQDKIADIQEKLCLMQEKERQLFDFFSRGIISADQLENMLGDHRRKRLSLNSELFLLKDVSREQLDDERYLVFPRILAQIRNRTLDNALYEQLFRESVHRVEIHELRVDLETCAGNFSLPRFRVNRRNFFPQWQIRLPPGVAEDNVFSSGQRPVEVVFACVGPEVLLRTNHLVFKTFQTEAADGSGLPTVKPWL